MNKQDYKKEFIERIKNGEAKDFNIKKVELSEEYKDYIIEQCRESVRSRTQEEIVQSKKLRYPGLPQSMKIKRSDDSPQHFFGINIKIGWWY